MPDNSKDFCFLFYPGDYLRDTQCFSEVCQVAYDRIMCEHMRNICITPEQLNFFTKRCSEDEKKVIAQLLTPVPGGFVIDWVRESILKRRGYSASRRENRLGGGKKNTPKTASTYVGDMSNTPKTYHQHMEIEIENKGGVGGKQKNGQPQQLGGGPEPVPEKFAHAVEKLNILTTDKWEAYYEKRLANDNEFRKYFGYGELPSS